MDNFLEEFTELFERYKARIFIQDGKVCIEYRNKEDDTTIHLELKQEVK